MEIEIVKVKSLRLNPMNPRTIREEKFRLLVKSVREFPEMLHIRPIVVTDGMRVLGGNMRLRACIEAGLTEVPIIRAGNLTPEQQREFIIKDNVGFGEWDWEALGNEWDADQLADWGLDVPGADFGGALDAQEDEYEMPDVDEVQTNIALGDLIEIGQHRLLCGDSADPSHVSTLMQGAKADIVFTDPPYGVAIGAKNRLLNSFQKAGRNLKDIKDDALSPEELKKALLPAFVNIKSTMSDDCTVFVTAPQGGELGMMMMMMKEAGLPVRHVLIWKKNAPTFSMGRLDYEYQHEPILLTWGKRHKYYGNGEHKTSVWEIDKPRSSKEHPTMKPVALVANALLNNSAEGDTVLDFYLGSGTTMVAAHQLGRKCYGMEIDPKYCQVIINRMKTLESGIPVNINGNEQPYTY